MENAAIKQKMAAASIKSNQATPFYVTFETAINGLTIKFKWKQNAAWKSVLL